MANYLNEDDLLKEIILSKGKGKLTDNLSNMIWLIAKNFIYTNNKSTYKSEDDMYDVMMAGYLMLLENWHKFDTVKYDKPFRYYTQIVKMGESLGYNKITGRRYNDDFTPKFIRMNEKNSYML